MAFVEKIKNTADELITIQSVKYEDYRVEDRHGHQEFVFEHTKQRRFKRNQ